MAYFGFAWILGGMLCSLVCIGLSIYGLINPGKLSERKIKVVSGVGAVLVAIAFFSLVALLLIGKYEFTAVYEVTSSQMQPFQKFTAVWGSKNGSLLFWSFLLSFCVAMAALGKWKGEKAAYFTWVMLILHVINLFFLGLIAFLENPFARLWLMPNANLVSALFSPANAAPFHPIDGQGLNPLLRHTGMVIHPPLIYLGFILFFIPYAYGLSSLILRRYDQNWVKYSHRWVVLGWSFLTLGTLLGSWWAYEVLGWGGYWGWDPVEISALMPWLTASGLIHSSIVQMRWGQHRRWNYVLIFATVLLMLFGIFLSRTGIIQSVHTYAQSSIGTAFMSFFSIMTVVTASQLLLRWRELRTPKRDFRLWTVPGLINYLNILFVIIVGICFYGVTLPLTTGLFTGVRKSVDIAFYEFYTAPFFLLVMLLMAIRAIPKQKWMGKLAVFSMLVPIGLLATGDRRLSALIGFWTGTFLLLAHLISGIHSIFSNRKHKRESEIKNSVKKRSFSWNSFFAHLGFALMALGVIGTETLDARMETTLDIGENVQLGALVIQKKCTRSYSTSDGRIIYEESYILTEKEKTLGQLKPIIIYYSDVDMVVSVPDIRSNAVEDIYIAITNWSAADIENSSISTYRFPLISWLWIGGVVMVVGVWIGMLGRKSS